MKITSEEHDDVIALIDAIHGLVAHLGVRQFAAYKEGETWILAYPNNTQEVEA